ncbi:alpha-L-rhamnosidase C-terminal domain-containing protein (plasmid) [Spirosoma sp. SC4-14]|uniref:alpha-L-rhamnosidase-related protein n=1 Tax=Spirosoma sp. SC4-14 TaxID=3128900 RepID=UPI0030CE9E6C
MRKHVLITLFVWVQAVAIAQIPNSTLPAELRQKPWSAKWIAVAGEPAQEYGVYHFRKQINLTGKPNSFVVHVSGDNRYKLFVNGQLASLGPARGDIHHWVFETIDLAPFLKEGTNTVAAVVWNFGRQGPAAQTSLRTGFILQGNSERERILDTSPAWKGIRNPAYSTIIPRFSGFLVVGPGEHIEAGQYPWGWETTDFDDRAWKPAIALGPGLVGGLFEPWYEQWELTPRTIPAMELRPERLSSVRNVEGLTIPAGFPQQAVALTIPAHTKGRLILDQGFETTAYTTLTISGGAGAVISLRQAEALNTADGNKAGRVPNKGNRNDIDGKRFVGYADTVISDGGSHRTFTSLWWRTYRYLELSVETKDAPLVVDDLSGIYTGYPFIRKATFSAEGAPDLNQILDIGWRTARLCAHETYIDCPYYEQMQYIGDTRIQALVSLFNSGDDRLMRNAIIQLRMSHGLAGLTQSRYPTQMPQYIPPFSLWWIAMVNDYLTYRGDRAFVRDQLPVSRAILHFFETHQTPSGLLANVPYWNFTDWAEAPGWRAGVSPTSSSGQSALLDLQRLLAYQSALALEQTVGLPDFARQYTADIQTLRQAIKRAYWDEKRQLFADTPDKQQFSQHANILAVLGGVVDGPAARQLMQRVLTDTSLTQATIYFKYYLHQAVLKAGLGDEYLNLLREWRNQIKLGLTTWAEQPEPSRSDCHAWGASPNIDLYRIVLGIDADAPGFAKVVISPHLGSLRQAAGQVPHPNGEISVRYVVTPTGKLTAQISLPTGVTGRFVWKGQEKPLKAGNQSLTLY